MCIYIYVPKTVIELLRKCDYWAPEMHQQQGSTSHVLGQIYLISGAFLSMLTRLGKKGVTPHSRLPSGDVAVFFSAREPAPGRALHVGVSDVVLMLQRLLASRVYDVFSSLLTVRCKQYACPTGLQSTLYCSGVAIAELPEGPYRDSGQPLVRDPHWAIDPTLESMLLKSREDARRKWLKFHCL